jgi:hypothetical protein
MDSVIKKEIVCMFIMRPPPTLLCWLNGHQSFELRKIHGYDTKHILNRIERLIRCGKYGGNFGGLGRNEFLPAHAQPGLYIAIDQKGRFTSHCRPSLICKACQDSNSVIYPVLI